MLDSGAACIGGTKNLDDGSIAVGGGMPRNGAKGPVIGSDGPWVLAVFVEDSLPLSASRLGFSFACTGRGGTVGVPAPPANAGVIGTAAAGVA